MIRRLFKFFLVSSVVLVGAGFVFGPRNLVRGMRDFGAELKDMSHELRSELRCQRDAERAQQDPEGALAARLDALCGEYAERIAAIEAQHAAVAAEQHKIAQDVQLCEQVIALCDADLLELEDSALSPAQKAARLEEINTVRTRYADRLADNELRSAALGEELALLEKGASALRSDHDQVEAERDRLASELAALERNEELAALLGATDETPLSARLAEIETELVELRRAQHEHYENVRHQRLQRQYEARAALERVAEMLTQ